MNGIELARRVSPMRRWMRILYMSGHSEEAVGQFGRMEDGSAFLNKPVTPKSLSRKVREVLAAPRIGPPAGV